DPKTDVANSEEAREFLGQSAGFENEVIRQSNFPHQPSREAPRAWPILLSGGRLWTSGLSSRTGLLGRNMPLTPRLAQGGKLRAEAGRIAISPIAWRNERALARPRFRRAG